MEKSAMNNNKTKGNNQHKTSTHQPSIGYWAAQEQHSMQDLIKFVVQAEKSGFDTTMTSDHFHPWWHTGGFGNFTWVWMAAAATVTKKMRFATGVTAPVYRYHPGIIAQAFASLDVLFPGRIELGIGTGEAINEVPLGYDWPSPKFRLSKTIDAIKVIRGLWKSARKEEEEKEEEKETEGLFNYNGKYFRIRDAKLYTMSSHHSLPSSSFSSSSSRSSHISKANPVNGIPLYMAAMGSQSVKAAARYADGLITFLDPEKTKEMGILETFKKTAEKEGKNYYTMEKIVEYKVSYSDDYEEAFDSAKFWRATLIDKIFNSSIGNPKELQEKAEKEVSDDKLKKSIEITTSMEDCIKSIEEYFKVGYSRVHVHSTSPDEINFIRTFCNKVLPYFQDNNRK